MKKAIIGLAISLSSCVTAFGMIAAFIGGALAATAIEMSIEKSKNEIDIPRIDHNDPKYITYVPVYYENPHFNTLEDAGSFVSLVKNIFDEQAGYISVFQFLNMAGMRTSSIHNNYGWMSLHDMLCVKSVKDGKYYVTMPTPILMEDSIAYNEIIKKEN